MLINLYYRTAVDEIHPLVPNIGKTDCIYLLHVLTPAPEQVYLSVVNDGLNWVTCHKFCFVNTEVNIDHSRVVIGCSFCYANPDWLKSYYNIDLRPSNSAS